MSALILPSRFRQQPQYPAPINPYWISRGLRFVNLPAAGLYNLAGSAGPIQSTGYTVSPMPSGIAYDGNNRAEYGSILPNASGVTLISVWRSRASSQYLGSDNYCGIIGNRTAGNNGWYWGRLSAVGGGSTGTVTRQFFVVNNVAVYDEDNYTIESLVDTPVACRYSKNNGLVSWFRFGVKSSADTAATTSPTTGENVNFGSGGSFAENVSPWIDRASITLGFVGELSDAEVYELTKSVSSVWQIFKAPPRFFFVPSVGGGGATAYTLPADSGTFALTGTDATLARSRILTADAASFALTGTAATLAKGRVVAADSGAFALTGTAATLTRGRVLAADSGTFALTGTAAVLEYTPVGGPTYTLTADPADFALTGTAAVLAHGHVLSADSNSIVLTGTDVTLTYTVPPSGEVTLSAQTISDIADAVYARFLLGAAPVNVIQFNGNPFDGTGRPGDPVTAL